MTCQHAEFFVDDSLWGWCIVMQSDICDRPGKTGNRSICSSVHRRRRSGGLRRLNGFNIVLVWYGRRSPYVDEQTARRVSGVGLSGKTESRRRFASVFSRMPLGNHLLVCQSLQMIRIPPKYKALFVLDVRTYRLNKTVVHLRYRRYDLRS